MYQPSERSFSELCLKLVGKHRYMHVLNEIASSKTRRCKFLFEDEKWKAPLHLKA